MIDNIMRMQDLLDAHSDENHVKDLQPLLYLTYLPGTNVKNRIPILLRHIFM